MMSINDLLNQFLGSQSGNTVSNGMEQISDKAKGVVEQVKQSGVGGFAGGALTGGLLTLLLSNDKVRSIAGGVVGYGGAAVLGAMACKAYENYKTGKANSAVTPVTKEDLANLDANYQPDKMTIANGEPFTLTLIKGMIFAAKADGHIDDIEQKRIFSEVEKMQLSSEHKAIVFDALSQPLDIDSLIRNVNTVESASELYLASLLAINSDNQAEQKYLATLAEKLKLPPELISHLKQQAQLTGLTI